MKFVCIEKTADLEFPDKTIRLWVGKKELEEGFRYEEELMADIRTFYFSEANRGNKSLIEFIAKLKHINAIQVITKGEAEEYGDMVYLVPF